MASFVRDAQRVFLGSGHRSTYQSNDLMRERCRNHFFRGGCMAICTKGLGFSGAGGNLRGELFGGVLEVAIPHSISHICATSALIARIILGGVFVLIT